MPWYFFDTDDGHTRVHDEEGCDLPDVQASRRTALETVTEMAGDPLPVGDHRRCTIDVRDAAGRAVYRATVELIGEWLT